MITRASALALLSSVAVCAGCITVYQPMSGLHRPVAIDPQYANFKDTTVRLQCVPAKFVGKSDMARLCRRVGRVFENQGARVQAEVSRGRVLSDPEVDDGETPPANGVVLDVVLRSERVHAQTAFPFFWDGEADITFAQHIVVRDETGFLLVRETLRGRFVRRIGWSSDAEEAFSKDYYGQLSQLVFNARMRWTVAGGGRRAAAQAPGSTPAQIFKAITTTGTEPPPPVNRIDDAPGTTVAPALDADQP